MPSNSRHSEASLPIGQPPLSSAPTQSASAAVADSSESVLFVIHDLRPGGAERVFLNYLRAIRRFRAVPVLVRRDIELLDGLSPDAVHDLGPAGQGPTQTRWLVAEVAAGAIALFSKARKLRRLASRYDARLVSTFLHKSHIIALAAKLLLEPRLCVVLNVHELLSQHLQHHFRPSQRPVMAWIARRFFPRADAIVAVAEGIKRDLVESFGIPAIKIVVVPNPVDLQLIRQRASEPIDPRLGEQLPPRLVIAVGRMVKLKGFDILLRAFARLPVELDVGLAFVGSGEEEPRLTALADELGVQRRVHFLGQQDNPWKFMARAQLLALSSLTEGFPNVIGEALTLGLPVVASDCSPGVRDYLENGRAGLLVPPGDVTAMTEALKRALTDQALREQLKARAPERMRDFELARVVPLYEAVLERTLRPA